MFRSKALSMAFRVSAVVMLCAIAFGCGKKEQGATASGQVVARIGDEVVTIQELETEFRWANIPAERQTDPAVVKQVLSELVLRKHLLQKAVNMKLDREPSVLLDIMRSRAQVLATAYVSRAVATKSITQTEVDKYIAGNPLKFANRRLISAEQIAFPFGSNGQAAVDAGKESNSLDEIDQKLTALSIPHNRSMTTFNSAEIPEDLFNLVQSRRTDVLFVRSGPNGVFLKLKGEEASPLQGEAAANAARQLLRADRVKAETGMASVSANLDAKYEGKYLTIMGNQGLSSSGD